MFDAVNRAYLWIFDRTGVYVATLSFAVWIGQVGCATRGRLNFLDFFFLTMMAIASAANYWAQGGGMTEEKFNKYALEFRSSVICKLFAGLIVGGALADAFSGWNKGDVPGTIITLFGEYCAVTWMFLQGCMIRKRQPPERRVRAGKLVTQ